mgnify:CR=1 FL=1
MLGFQWCLISVLSCVFTVMVNKSTLFYILNSNGLLENMVERKILKNNRVVISDFGEKYAFFSKTGDAEKNYKTWFLRVGGGLFLLFVKK